MNDLSLADRIARTIRQDVASMHAYAVQPSEGLLKLDAMENPFALPPELQRALGERLAGVALNRYPVRQPQALASALARFCELPEGCALMLGNGSDELIDLLSVAVCRPGATLLAPVPGFVMYEMSAKLRGLDFAGVPLMPDFALDVPAMLDAIAARRPALVYLACPNNPTANLWALADVERIVEAVGEAGGFVVVDEAYQPFASRSWMPRLPRPAHVLVMRTLSKFGLAGLRIGYLCGATELVAQIEKVRPPYNVSALNAEAALFALEHADTYARQAALLVAERERLQAELAATPGLEPFPSEANMILVRVPARPGAARVFAAMRERGVLVKNVSSLHPLLSDCLRLTVGTPDENARMLAALRQSIQPETRP